MVNITIKSTDPIIIADCYNVSDQNKTFTLKIDPDTKELIEKPEKSDIDFSAAYSRLFGLLMSKKPLPDKISAEWG